MESRRTILGAALALPAIFPSVRVLPEWSGKTSNIQCWSLWWKELVWRGDRHPASIPTIEDVEKRVIQDGGKIISIEPRINDATGNHFEVKSERLFSSVEELEDRVDRVLADQRAGLRPELLTFWNAARVPYDTPFRGYRVRWRKEAMPRYEPQWEDPSGLHRIPNYRDLRTLIDSLHLDIVDINEEAASFSHITMERFFSTVRQAVVYQEKLYNREVEEGGVIWARIDSSTTVRVS